jgi:hypothetical protein
VGERLRCFRPSSGGPAGSTTGCRSGRWLQSPRGSLWGGQSRYGRPVDEKHMPHALSSRIEASQAVSRSGETRLCLPSRVLPCFACRLYHF